ncbi:MAG: Asp23/Gls24 family envelope stress response protein [Clostridia bacterium]|nr:Asp23/Gls24 family envelope stress response protein [Clostridia bacterium]
MENIVNPEIEENGNVNISDEVVSIIASLAATEVKGVAGMNNSLPGGIAEFLGKKSLSKGVKVTFSEKTVVLDLSIIAEYGTKIPDVAWKVQEKVKSEVEAMTGLTVTAVNISVDGVNVPKPEAAPVAEEGAESETITTEE